MAKIIISCRKCGKDIKLDLADSEALCRKCRKNQIGDNPKTTKNFDF